MAVRPIVLYPVPVLLTPTRDVDHVDDGIRSLIRDLAETMYAAPGIGLAANQIGVSSRVCVVDLSAGDTPGELKVFVNPRIVEVDGKETGEEGCLSFPDITLDIDRATRIRVEAQDGDGRPFSLEADDLLARAIQHEVEHLEGRVFLQNVSPLKRELVKRQIKKRMKTGDWIATAAR
jgi:peptide deformylase